MPALSGEPALSVRRPAAPVQAVALVLPGGRAAGLGPVRGHQPAVLRMRPFRSALRSAGSSRGLAVAGLRYAVRGWNGAAQSPVADVREALGRLGAAFPGVPVALVGHSMGGRAAIHAGGADAVRAVVALAPWLERDDPWQQLAGRHLLVVHGTQDRITSRSASAAFAREAAAVAASVGYVSVHAERHAMLRRARLWHDLVTGWVLARMCAVAPSATVGGAAAGLLDRLLAGEPALSV